MHCILSTDTFAPMDRFRRWRETIHEVMIPVELSLPDGGPFRGSLEVAEVGPMAISRISTSAVLCEGTQKTYRKLDRPDTLFVTILTAGQYKNAHGDVASVQSAGDIVLFEPRPTLQSMGDSRALVMQIPRERVERVLGPARLYAGLLMDGRLPGTSLARTFFEELARLHEALSPEMAERMASVGIDLLLACLADRMAQETPRSVQSVLIVQRAKAYIEANLGDTNLDPPHVALAVGTSRRRLQQLFSERGRNVSDWIWQRRLETAALRLTEPSQMHIAIGELCFGCGFSNQAHFSRRFRDRYGMTPREYRQAAMTAKLQSAR